MLQRSEFSTKLVCELAKVSTLFLLALALPTLTTQHDLFCGTPKTKLPLNFYATNFIPRQARRKVWRTAVNFLTAYLHSRDNTFKHKTKKTLQHNASNSGK
jgi:hypothetical protein